MTFNVTQLGKKASNLGDSDVYIYSVAEAVGQATVLMLIVVFGVIGNLYCVRVICKNKKLRNPTFIFLCNLALCNMVALLLCSPFPLAASFHRRNVLGVFWCRASGFLNNLFFCASIITHSLIASQKYYTVVRPTRWSVLHINKTKARYLVFIVWLVCGILSLVVLGPFENWSYVVFNKTTAHCGISFPRNLSERVRLGVLALAAFVAPICIMSYAYTRIYLKIRAHERRARCRQMTSVSGKLSVTLGLMFGTFVFCWLPFFLLIVFSIAFEDASELPWSLGRLAYWSGYLNCCINPTLYCLRSSAFREALKTRASLTKHRESLGRIARATKESSEKLRTLSRSVGEPLAHSADRRTRHYPTWGCRSYGPGNQRHQRPRIQALSLSSGYDLTKVSKIDEGIRENFVFLEDGIKSETQSPSTFGAQHALLSLRSLTESPSGKRNSAQRPALLHYDASAQSLNDNCG